jgi:hypothetical protein
MKTIRMTTETRPCLMLEGIPLRLMLTDANQRAAERANLEAQERTFTDADLTDGEQVFRKVVNS